MQKISSQKGSVTILVLVSCLFFLASIVGIQIHLKSKEMMIEKEYLQIKESYENTVN